ncbi:hypothetical protein ACSBR1_017307 [Camellia fascicularis]
MDMEVENDYAWKPKQGMTFDSEQCAYDFYNAYRGRMGFSIRRDYSRKNKFTNQLICRLLVCNKEGFRKVDKRDPLAENPRAKTRTGCEARLYVKLDEYTGKFVVIDFKEKHNHDLVSPECAHMLPSQRKILATQAIELDLAAQSGLHLGQSFKLMDIEEIEYAEACTIFTVVDVGSKHARKVKMERDGSLGCSCTKFEREGILCSHSLKVIRDILKIKEVPSQYILKRWTKHARAETVKDIKE